MVTWGLLAMLGCSASLAAITMSLGSRSRTGSGAPACVAGDRAQGEAALQALAVDPGWAAFGVIAAEAELKRGFRP